MTEAGESIAVNVDGPAKEGDKCWYCEEEPTKQHEPDLIASPETREGESCDETSENDLENCASKLGIALGNEPKWVIMKPDDSGPTAVVPGAHHCIPGNASFGNCEPLVNLIKEKKVGYSINHQNNGIWLPGNYGVRPDNEDWKKKWSDHGVEFKTTYAERAMARATVQFHDAHYQYNKKVKEALDALMAKIKSKDKKCPICQKEYDPKRPPHGLVGRLDHLSMQLRGVLTNLNKGDEKVKKMVANGYFTSSRVKTYFGVGV